MEKIPAFISGTNYYPLGGIWKDFFNFKICFYKPKKPTPMLITKPITVSTTWGLPTIFIHTPNTSKPTIKANTFFCHFISPIVLINSLILKRKYERNKSYENVIKTTLFVVEYGNTSLYNLYNLFIFFCVLLTK